MTTATTMPIPSDDPAKGGVPIGHGVLFGNGTAPGNGVAAGTDTPNGNAPDTSFDTDPPAGNGAPPGSAPRSTTWRGHDRDQVTRIIAQALDSLGYRHSVATLLQESGTVLEHPPAIRFRHAILDGDWDLAESLIADSTIPVLPGHSPTNILFALRQQCFLELLELRDPVAALALLRTRITPLRIDPAQLHELTSLAMCGSAEEVRQQAKWDGAAGSSRSVLLARISKMISPDVMLPDNRLANLLDQVKSTWCEKCTCHNTKADVSLFYDHSCSLDDMPTESLVELDSHTDEVWYVRFSNDGTKLATASSDRTVHVYDTTTFARLTKLGPHEGAVSHVAWSPDDSMIVCATRGSDFRARLWQVETEKCLSVMSCFGFPVSTSVWAPDGRSFVTASQDPLHPLLIWNVATSESSPFTDEELRVHDAALSPDGHRLAVLLEDKVLVYDFRSRHKIAVWAVEAGESLTSLAFSANNRDVLLGMNMRGLHLMDVTTGRPLVGYFGHKQRSFVIRSSFGGVDESFVLCGSEDSRLMIWKRSGEVAVVIDAHNGTAINSAHWNPVNPYMIATGGDDGNVRIWVPSRDLARLKPLLEQPGAPIPPSPGIIGVQIAH